MEARLPPFMRFKTALDLIRLGRNYDGGYLISQSDLLASDALIGLGVNDDWSFESDFYACNQVPVTVYDGSISGRWFLAKGIIALLFKFSRRWLKTYLAYTDFFRGKCKHVKKFVGLYEGKDTYSMAEVFEQTDASALFLKIDIEGSEYSCLETLIEQADRITGLVIEFHECGTHLSDIEDFIKRFKHNLVHVHANNHAPIDKVSGLPSVMELTFSSHAVLDEQCTLPHVLDQPNKKEAEEII